jgi:hypothetical protein
METHVIVLLIDTQAGGITHVHSLIWMDYMSHQVPFVKLPGQNLGNVITCIEGLKVDLVWN